MEERDCSHHLMDANRDTLWGHLIRRRYHSSFGTGRLKPYIRSCCSSSFVLSSETTPAWVPLLVAEQAPTQFSVSLRSLNPFNTTRWGHLRKGRIILKRRKSLLNMITSFLKQLTGCWPSLISTTVWTIYYSSEFDIGKEVKNNEETIHSFSANICVFVYFIRKIHKYLMK